jgi:uncharacterized protein YdeI (YjbR/CyaY-like superfamily)
MKEEIYFKNRKEWRKWLEGNHNSPEGIWMIMYKKHTGRECIPYAEAVEEALCFGWIDGKLKRINDEYYIQVYTPRRPGSRWSKYNIEKVKKLISEGKMTSSGLEAYNIIFKNPGLVYDNRALDDSEIPEDLLSALRANKTAFDNFMKFPPSARKLYILWSNDAKRDKTRIERIKKIVRLSEQNTRPGIL